MLSVINKPIILSVIKLIVVMLNIMAPQNSVCRLRVQILKLAMTNAGLGDFHNFFHCFVQLFKTEPKLHDK
jgi:hypothetical protein